MTDNMEGKVALVTGSSSGIGRGAAIAFAKHGASVIVNANSNVEGGEETVSLIEKAGGKATFIKADVSVEADVKAMIDKTIQVYGKLDCVLNNAGVSPRSKALIDYTEEDWDRILNINLKGMWLCMKYEIPRMLEQGKGAIVNMASIGGLGAIPNALGYIVSKHGVIGLTRAGAVEYAKAGIRINAICPGVIATPMFEKNYGGQSEAVRIAQRPIERVGTTEEIGEAVVWLCSDAASFVVGSTFVVDGGVTINQTTPGTRR